MLVGGTERLIEIRLGQPLHRQPHANDPLRLLHCGQRGALAQAEVQLAATLQQDHAVPTRKGERQAALGRLFEQRGDFVYIEFGHRPAPPAIRSDPTSLRSKHSNRVQPA